MMKIKSAQLDLNRRYDARDVNIRRLLGQLEDKKNSVDRAIRTISTLLPQSGYTMTLPDLAEQSDLVQDLEFIFGDWQRIARGDVI
ncbi:MAG: hypothetical protein ACXAC5_03200 [Promethearchaeota archaeon]|jgi:hypothetical protein